MAKLVFYYGSMNSSKTAQLIMTVFNFEQQGKSYVAMKSAKDTRDKDITSRALEVSIPCTPVLHPDDIVKEVALHNPKWVFVDEVQFMTKEMIDTLSEIANSGVNVVCYGLLTDFTGHLFEGSKRLVECADSIREIKNQCVNCENKAIRNLRLVDNQPVFEGKIIQVGKEESYRSLCRSCYDRIQTETIGMESISNGNA